MDRSGEKSEQIVNLPSPDYAADDVMVVSEPQQLRALGNDLRSRIVVLLRERARSTTELAELVDLPRGTVGHHVKVLERARLIRVVRTRKVRALTERYYGRTARLFLFKSAAEDDRNVADAGVLRRRLSDADARRFTRRLEQLRRDFLAATEAPDGKPYGLAAALYRRASDA